MPPYLSSKLAEGARYGTLTDVAQTRRISRAKTYQLIAAGKIIARKLGARTLIDLESLDRFLASLPTATDAPSNPPRRRKAVAS